MTRLGLLHRVEYLLEVSNRVHLVPVQGLQATPEASQQKAHRCACPGVPDDRYWSLFLARCTDQVLQLSHLAPA